MNHRFYLCLALLGFCGGPEIHSAKEKTSMMKQTTWELNTTNNLGGYATQVLGAPRLIESPQGKAMEFDGQQDGIIVDTNPFDGREMRHYVNGVQEMAALIQYQPMKPGQISLGVRLNRVFWFKGAIRKVRFTHDALAPADFLKP